MYQLSEKISEVILGDERTFSAKIVVNGTEITDGFKAIKQTILSSSNSYVSIGGAIASYVDIEMWKPDVQLENQEIDLYIGVILEEEVEWAPLGLYTAQKPQNNDGVIKFTAYDRIQSKLVGAYFSKLTYPIDGKTVLAEIAEMTGVPINTDNLPDGIMIQRRKIVTETGVDDDGEIISETTYEEPFNGYTYREALGYVAMLYCKFAVSDRRGTIVFRWYDSVDCTINPDRYFDDLTTTEVVFEVGKITCATGEETLTAGSGTENIQLENPVMTQEILNNIYQQAKDLRFLPAGLSFLGDMRLDVGDIVTVNDKYGNVVKIPLMSIIQEYDGGLLTKAQSFSGTDENTTAKGPTLQRIERTYAELFLVKELIGSKASFDYVYGKVGEYDALKVKQAEFEEVTAQNFLSVNARIETLTANAVTTDNLAAKVAEIGVLTAETADLKYATIASLNTTDAKINNLTSIAITTDNLSANVAALGYATVGSLDAAVARIGVLETETIKLNNLSAEVAKLGYATVEQLSATNANVEKISGDLATYKTTVSEELLVAKGWMSEGSIGDAQISNVSANKLTAGTIDTAVVNISGTDGRLQISDNTIQISDADNVRVQIGKDASGDYSMSVWDTSGNLIWDALGATEHTIQRQIIRDSMVADDAAIQALKIDFQSFDTALTQQGVVISGTVVQVGSKSLNVALSEQSQTISDNYASLVNYTDTAKAAAISTAASDATTKANSALSSAQNYADAAVEGIEIGGRNLLKKTKDFTVTDSNCKSELTGETYKGLAIRHLDTTDINSGFKEFARQNNVLYPEYGEFYTLSFYAKGTGAIMTYFYGSTGYLQVKRYKTSYTDVQGKYYDDGNCSFTVNEEWERYWVVYQCGPDSSYGDPSIAKHILFRQYYGNDIYICGAKLEKGNKATDWTPAPEDTQSQIDNTNATIATHTETLSTHTSQIAANESAIALRVTTQDFNSYKTTVNEELTSAKSRLTTAESSITAMKGEIALKVEQTDIDTAVANIQIGGRNLIRNTATFEGWISVNNATISDGVVTFDNSKAWQKAEMWLGTGVRADYEGKTIVVSFDIKSDDWSEVSNGLGGIAFQLFECNSPLFGTQNTLVEYKKYFISITNSGFYQSGTAKNGEWVRIKSKPITISESLLTGDYDSQDYIALYIGKIAAAGIVQIRHVMIEESTKASDWTPAPEDIDASISDVDAKFANYSTTTQMTAAITAAKNSITQTVSETYSTKAELSTVSGNVSALTTRVSTAESKLTKDSLVTTIGSYYSTQTYVDEELAGKKNDIYHICSSSGGTAGYFRIARIVIKAIYANQPITLTIANRGKQASTCIIRFTNQNSVDPSLDLFQKTGNANFYINKADTSTWDLYIQKAESYDYLAVTDFSLGGYASKFTWTWVDETVTAAISGWTTATQLAASYTIDTTPGGTSGSNELITSGAVYTEMTSVKTIATQTSEKFNWLVASGTSSTDFTLTDRTATLIAQTISLNGNVKVNGAMIVDGSITASELAAGAVTADKVLAGAITTDKLAANAITAAKLATDAIKSANYAYSSGNFSTAGTFLDLSTGLIRSKNFAIDSSGNAYFSGSLNGATGSFSGSVTTSNIIATGGTIAGWTVSTGGITKKNDNSQQVYVLNGTNTNKDFLVVNELNTDGTWKSTPFFVRANGQMYAANATISGSITATSLTAYDNVKILQNGGTTPAIALQAPASTGVSSLEVGSGFGQVVIPKLLYLKSGATIVGTVSMNDNLCMGGALVNASNKMMVNYTDTATNHSELIQLGNANLTVSVYSSGNLWKNGSSTTYFATTSTSDRRLKEHVSDLAEYEDFFMDLKPIAFKYHDGLYNAPKKQPLVQWGFYAQDTIEAFTRHGIDWYDQELVVVEDGDLSAEEMKYVDSDMLKMNYQNMTAMNTHMIQKNSRCLAEIKEMYGVYASDLSLIRSNQDTQDSAITYLRTELAQASGRIEILDAQIRQLQEENATLRQQIGELQASA